MTTRGSKVKLSSIDTLTFYNGAETTFRRTSPVPQLTCQGSKSICRQYAPDVIQCQNMGGTAPDIQWRCEAELPSSVKLGRVEVSCEGYAHADDEYVLKGSCGLTYSLVQRTPDYDDGSLPWQRNNKMSYDDILSSLFYCLFLAMLAYFVYSFVRSFFRPEGQRAPGTVPPRGDGGGGGGGWGPGFGGGPPPPPYSKSPDTTSTGWRPGFWSGLAGGMAAQSLLNRNTRSMAPQRDSWFGGRGGMNDYQPRAGPSRERESMGGGSMRTSAGFGGTRNR
ncbi:uncharacterized protein L969DRAFT_93926 [Mixia osmundae IAM 14324]|uniref:Store-operated calcium entry-associated regulatory factor n=1 Tax=Mixia osmundae (strain CBS 9802 / IAM 14324 / JCM 22182 / KY 12970) TaxID=764103 RepID=G7E9Z7_MIXOS|nr:uncharacterized protein L969DRAFT_93926 [Mixia osmundae IAM 14324]KEI40100.1 hypothetical protein L969DRAFT_93926 [Mixia osmundae IAM 14324]GAA99466.1 hypothetical protein E5Q_06165 [Mixia osmundae IAM 14324]